jgi:hypothetical protein
MMSGTPLNETIIAAHEIVKRFRLRHRVQKMNTIFLTDGDGSNLRYIKNHMCDQYEKTNDDWWRNDAKITIGGNELSLSYGSSSTYAKLIKNLKKTRNTALIGFYISYAKSDFKKNSIAALRYTGKSESLSWSAAVTKFNAVSRIVKKDRCFPIPHGFNYDMYFVFDSPKSLDSNAEEFSCDSLLADNADILNQAAHNKIAKEFTKFNVEKRTAKVFLNKFVEIIA